MKQIKEAWIVIVALIITILIVSVGYGIFLVIIDFLSTIFK